MAAFVKDSGITDVTINSSLVTSSELAKIDDIVASISAINQDGTLTASASNYIVDILSQFKFANWNELWDMNIFNNYSGVVTSMKDSYSELEGIYSFLGMNIMEVPTWKNLTILVPVLAVVTQFINNKLISANSNVNAEDNPTAASMNTMNNIMPFVSGAFCFMFPIGVGLYWVAGSVFRSIQSIFINMYFNKVGVDEIAAKNIEKRRRKLERKGIDPDAQRMQQFTNIKTSSIKSDAGSISKNLAKIDNNRNSGNYTKSSKQDLYVNHNVRKGSLSDYANMLNRDYVSNNADSDEE